MGYSEKDWQERVAYRMDLSGYLVHLTKPATIDGNSFSSIDVLLKILREKVIRGSTTESGFIVGDTPSVCLFDAPLYSICENLHYEYSRKMKLSQSSMKYDAYGLMLPKPYVFRGGGRPVVYDKTEEAKEYLPKDKWWRIVNLNYDDPINFIDWSHEREWRFPVAMSFDLHQTIVLVPNSAGYKEFYNKGKAGGENVTDQISCVIPIWQQYL